MAEFFLCNCVLVLSAGGLSLKIWAVFHVLLRSFPLGTSIMDVLGLPCLPCCSDFPALTHLELRVHLFYWHDTEQAVLCVPSFALCVCLSQVQPSRCLSSLINRSLVFSESCNPLGSEWSYWFVESFFFPWNSAFSPKFSPRSGAPEHCFLTYDPFLSEKILSDNGYIGTEDRYVRQAWENGSVVACLLSKREDLSSNHQNPCTDRHGSICQYPPCFYYEIGGKMGRSQELGASQPGVSGSKHETLSVWNKVGDKNWHPEFLQTSPHVPCVANMHWTHTHTFYIYKIIKNKLSEKIGIQNKDLIINYKKWILKKFFAILSFTLIFYCMLFTYCVTCAC